MAGALVKGGIGVRPQDGDLVVIRMSGADGPFSLQQVPGTAQLRASTRKAAVQLARGFAQSHAVDLWCTDRDTYRLLECYRPRKASAGPEQKGGPR
jgi:hypothetical protein